MTIKSKHGKILLKKKENKENINETKLHNPSTYLRDLLLRKLFGGDGTLGRKEICVESI